MCIKGDIKPNHNSTYTQLQFCVRTQTSEIKNERVSKIERKVYCSFSQSFVEIKESFVFKRTQEKKKKEKNFFLFCHYF